MLLYVALLLDRADDARIGAAETGPEAKQSEKQKCTNAATVNPGS